MVARRILLIAHLAPPTSLTAGRRVAGLASHLTRQGHEVTVLTSMVNGAGPVEHAARTVKARDLMVSRFNWRRASFEALTQGSDAVYDPTPSRVTAFVVPDIEAITWLPFAAARLRRLLGEHDYDCVITTHPPPSSHLLGLIAHASGLPWVADFRDGWRFEFHRPFTSRVMHAIDAALERATARRADVVVAISDPLADDLRDRVGASDPLTITNGFDPDELGDLGPPPERITTLVSPDRHSLLHTGRMAYVGRDPRPLLQALRLLAEREPDVARRIEVLFAGPLSSDEAEWLADPALDGMARAVGSLAREDALALQRAADSLLVLTGMQRRGEATQKIFEYLAAERPILVLGDDTAAATIVERSQSGFAAPVDDPEAIAVALRRLVAGEAPVVADGASRFSYARLAEQMADAVELAIARHSGGRSQS